MYTLIYSAHIPLLSFYLVSDLLLGVRPYPKLGEYQEQYITCPENSPEQPTSAQKRPSVQPLFLTGMKYSLGNLSRSHSANPVMSYFKKQLFFKKKRERATYNYIYSNWAI